VIKSVKISEHVNHNILINKNGTEIVIAESAAPIIDAGGNIIGVILVFRNITEKRKIESHLQQSMKMEAIATLAGGIAHEFNNALVGITGNIELLQKYPSDSRTIDRYNVMKESAYRMASLTNQLLAYARGGKYQPVTIPLNNFVEATLPVIKHSFDPTIRFETDLPRDIFSVEVDIT
jgi:two-component system cell cycle sensor histidine kinase/response regulator CckA